MLGRTLLQPATPLALGQKIAGWASDLDRAARRLEASFRGNPDRAVRRRLGQPVGAMAKGERPSR